MIEQHSSGDQDDDSSKRQKVDMSGAERLELNRTPTADEMLASLSGGWTPERVKVNEWQLYPARLAEILALEKEDVPLTTELVQQKNTLFSMGFPKWDRNDFRIYLKACVEKGKDEVQEIAMELPEKTLEEVTRYAIAFWERGATCFTSENWSYIQHVVNQGRRNKEEAALEAVRGLIREKLSRFGKPRLHLHKSVSSLLGHEYCEEEDVLLLTCLVERKTPAEVSQFARQSPAFAFDHFFRWQAAEDFERRTQALIEIVKKDQEETVRAEIRAQKEREAREQEEQAITKREHELMARIEELERALHAPAAPATASSAPEGMIASSPAAHSPAPGSPTAGEAAEDGGSDAGAAGALDPRYYEAVLRVVTTSGSCGMAQLVDKVSRVLPDGTISKRQLKREIQALAVKEKKAGDRAARWYPVPEALAVAAASAAEADTSGVML